MFRNQRELLAVLKPIESFRQIASNPSRSLILNGFSVADFSLKLDSTRYL